MGLESTVDSPRHPDTEVGGMTTPAEQDLGRQGLSETRGLGEMEAGNPHGPDDAFDLGAVVPRRIRRHPNPPIQEAPQGREAHDPQTHPDGHDPERRLGEEASITR